MANRVVDILTGVWAGLVAQMAYDIIANAGNATEWQDRFEAGIVILVVLGVFIGLIHLSTRQKSSRVPELHREKRVP